MGIDPTSAGAEPAHHAVTDQQILDHPPEGWTVINARGTSLDVDFRRTSLLTTINDITVRLESIDYDPSPWADFRPNQIGPSGRHHWNSRDPLFDAVAGKIANDLNQAAQLAADSALDLIRGSVPEAWERGPRSEYRGGEFSFGGYRRAFFDQRSESASLSAPLCREGYVGRIGHTSFLLQEMNDGSIRGEVAVGRGDFYKICSLDEEVARSALEAVRALQVG
jgi:hypothetical protein